MNDQYAQAGYAAYETDPLFGAFPRGYDAQQQQYGNELEQQYGSKRQEQQEQQEQHHYATGEYPAPAQQYAYTYAYAEPTGQWDGRAPGPGPGPYGPSPASVPDAPGQEFGYEQGRDHAYAYAAAGTTQAQDPYGCHQQQPATGYEPTTQWTVPAEAPLTPPDGQAPQAPHDTQVPHDPHDPQTRVHPGPATLATAPAFEPGPQQGLERERAAEAGPETETETGLGTDAGQGFERVQGPTPGSASGPPSGPRVGSRTAARAAGGRSRRRAPAKRSALFTIAVPSACVMGVAGIAAASMGAMGGGDDTQDDTATTAASDPSSVKPVAANDKVDTQLAALNADARDFGDRASRTQERIDLKERQAADKKKRDEAAARKEAARPKYLLPVKQRGLSAYFGQAGVNWMSVHTGIDFPVMTGTPVMAATDGTVRTQWNSSYGNMAIVKAPDGTETWYCHLSSTRVRSGSVKAGDVIAYSGNTGNTTGPHLHFEVRPDGGAAIDPLPWLRGHGLDPT